MHKQQKQINLKSVFGSHEFGSKQDHVQSKPAHSGPKTRQQNPRIGTFRVQKGKKTKAAPNVVLAGLVKPESSSTQTQFCVNSQS